MCACVYHDTAVITTRSHMRGGHQRRPRQQRSPARRLSFGTVLTYTFQSPNEPQSAAGSWPTSFLPRIRHATYCFSRLTFATHFLMTSAGEAATNAVRDSDGPQLADLISAPRMVAKQFIVNHVPNSMSDPGVPYDRVIARVRYAPGLEHTSATVDCLHYVGFHCRSYSPLPASPGNTMLLTSLNSPLTPPTPCRPAAVHHPERLGTGGEREAGRGAAAGAGRSGRGRGGGSGGRC